MAEKAGDGDKERWTRTRDGDHTAPVSTISSSEIREWQRKEDAMEGSWQSEGENLSFYHCVSTHMPPPLPPSRSVQFGNSGRL